MCVANYRVEDKQSNLSVVPIGKPISNVKIYIVDERLNPLPVGGVGEICIAGICVARGYRSDSAMQQKHFVDNPFKPGTKLYRTGDLGKHLPDGNVVFVGRKDEQVKVRGFRIELGEIENALLKHTSVSGAVVIVEREEEGRSNFLVAYYIASEMVTREQLKMHLVKLVPGYMIPSFLVQVNDFPLTATGKIDRKCLPDPFEADNTTTNRRSSPENQTKQMVLDIWKKILHHDTINTTDNFFDVGGDSLKIIHLHKEIMSHFNRKISIADLFIYNSVDTLSAFLGDDIIVEKDIEV